MNRFRQWRNRLFVKQAIASVAVAFAIGGVLAVTQIYFDMRAERERIYSLGAKRLEPAIDTLTLAAFRLDEKVALDLVRGLLKDEAVVRVTVRDDFGDTLAEVTQTPPHTPLLIFGSLFGNNPILTTRNLKMEFEDLKVGTVILAVDPVVASRNFSHRTFNVLIAEIIKSLLMALALMAYFYHTGTRRINELNARYNVALETWHGHGRGDEIDNLSDSLDSWAKEKTDLVAQLDDMAKRVKLAASVANIGIWEHNIDTDVLHWDETMHEIFEVPRSNFSGRYVDWRNSVHPEDVIRCEKKFKEAITNGAIFDDQYRITTPDGREKHIEAKAQVVVHEDGRRLAIGVNFDISDRVNREEELIAANKAATEAKSQLSYDASHDSLTNLHNRRALDAHLNFLSLMKEDGVEVAFLQIDLDGFKSINDAFGHKVGDYVLKVASNTLRSFEAEDAFVARLGGDEFSLVMTGTSVLHRAETTAKKIIECCSKPLEYNNHVLHFGASVGIATGTASQLDMLHENADIALYVAKRSRGEDLAVFDREMRLEAERHKRIADGLRVALQEHQLVAYFQPKFFAGSRKLAGLEALVRWQHPELGVMSPAEFLPIAEEIGLERDIDRRVLQLAASTVRRLEAANIHIPEMAVNVSLQRLKDPSMLQDIDELLSIDCKFVFEILETIDLDLEYNELRLALIGLQKRSIHIEVDDFGTGRASITSLLSLRPDGLKLDRTLVSGAPGVPAPGEEMLQALVDIARATDTRITAEGVETEEQAQMLEKLGCDVLQGYLFARPMSEEELISYLQI